MDSKKRRRVLVLAALQLLESDSDDDLITIITNYKKKPKKNPISRISIRNYENVVALYNSEVFKSHFRLNRETFEYILGILGPLIIEQNINGTGRHTYRPEKQLLVVLSMLANQQVYRMVAEKFNISKSTAWSYVQKVCTALVNLSGNYILWPKGEKAQETIKKFKERQGFPGVLGAIDGSHIPITPPSDQQTAYCNRKSYHSIILQAICDADYRFTDVFAGYAGSVHDARVFNNSHVGKKINTVPLELFPNTNTHILGDSAYKCTNYVLTPYRDNGHLTRIQKNYNFKHSSTRVHIEQCFGLLKGRFRILKHVNVYNTEFIPKIIVACCVLHNICVEKQDSAISNIEEEEEDNFEEINYCDKENIGCQKRNIIANKLFIE